ncbi:3'(2'),5'-bisphosphate nucleotidase CysQ [Actinomadura kijaniata]|uniref:inositol-phosphate phosphatase n=1 Tax=Actinomadura namibiensis TaxID=182080 RepID=A0A7W3QQF0_ACTNM|nr:3'(2'),5'-bisphosphate nucleotidase CysQ [Actinomadura namibiensis]MBA8955556.1 3'(2'), 5'-bisphosphate nucleotidase [Actinomadura namibiensis]
MTRWPEDDHELAAALASAAGDVLLTVRAERGHGDARALKEAGDRRSHDFLAGALAEARPGDAVLSEEGRDDPARLDADRVWIVDPLDGTREFSEEGRADWAVHVALWEKGRLTAGAVALPGERTTLRTAGSGALAGDAPLVAPAPDASRIRVAVSRTRPPDFVQRLAETIDAEVELVPIGSAGVKISSVLLGRADAYLHAGGQYEWDSAAPVAVALASGAHASRIDGAELRYNQRDTWLPDLLVCHPSLAPLLLAGVRDIADPPPVPGLSSTA